MLKKVTVTGWCALDDHQRSLCLCVEHMACCLLLVPCVLLSIVCPLQSCLLHHCFSRSTCVSLVTLLVCLPIYPPGVFGPVLICCFTSSVLCLPVLQLSACLPACLPACLSVCLFFPPRGGFVSDEAFWTSEAFNPIVWKSFITRSFLKRFMLCPSSGHKNE